MGSKYLTVGVAAKLTVHVPVLLVHGVKQVIGLRLVFWFERGLSKKAVLNKRIGFLKYLACSRVRWTKIRNFKSNFAVALN